MQIFNRSPHLPVGIRHSGRGDWDSINNYIHDNVIVHLGTQGMSGAYAKAEHETLYNGNNLFDNNTYVFPDSGQKYWWFEGAPRLETELADFGMEQNGTFIYTDDPAAWVDAGIIVASTDQTNVFFSGPGDDMLSGTDRTDIFVLANNSGNDVISEFTPGTDSDDVIDVSDFGFAGLEDLLARGETDASSGDTIIALNEVDSLTLVGVSVTDLHENDFFYSE